MKARPRNLYSPLRVYMQTNYHQTWLILHPVAFTGSTLGMLAVSAILDLDMCACHTPPALTCHRPCLLEDGICCKYRNGFITLTRKSSDVDKEVVFKHNGDFKEELKVYFRVSDDGRTIEICKSDWCQ